jgi:alkylhydroperoxidase/carboxymuconolactone decarboxylase family protein YurZ
VTTIAPAAANRLIDLAPDLLASYQSFVAAVIDGGTLEPQARAAAALAVAITVNRPEAVRSYLAAAKQAGLSNEDIGQIAAIVDVIRLETHQKSTAGAVPAVHEHVHTAPKASKSCC